LGKHAEHRALVRAFAFCLCLAGLFPLPAAAACRLALALGFDVSRSVDEADYAIQRQGIIAALATPEIRDAFLKPDDWVALSVFEWSGQADQAMVIDWTPVRSDADLIRISAAIATHERQVDFLPTAIGAALDYARELFKTAPECPANTLDLSGDGRNNDGLTPEQVYARNDFGDLMVNGLAIGGHEADIAIYYRHSVIRGRGAFVEVAKRHTDFPPAIRRKLEKELTEQVLGRIPVTEAPG
jgi:hypothetical protein